MKDNPQKQSGRGIKHLTNAFAWSLAGIKVAWRHEQAFRQECLLIIPLAPLGLWLGRTGTDRALLLGSLLLVLVVELLNSSLEAVVDRIGPKRHPLAGRAKDLGSAAVLLALLHVLCIWGLVLLPW